MSEDNRNVALDPRRFFTTAEVTAAWLAQDRRCKDCTREIPRDFAEGDHIVAWSAGGETSMENLQVLCVACNKRKGKREGVIEEPSVARVAPATRPLWRWQTEALPLVLSRREPVLIEACPGAGKTLFALECAARLFESGEVNRLLVIVPTSRLSEQWIEAASAKDGGPMLPLAPFGWRPTQPLLRNWVGATFTYHALFAQTTMLQALASEPGFRTLVIFDEVHHAGSDSGWGVAAQEAFAAAAKRILSLSGTAFRTKDPIVFVPTVNGISIADYTYGYASALVDGACRPLRFVGIGGTATFQTPSGSVETVSFEDELNETGESYRLRTVLSPTGGHLRTMLEHANQQLASLRATSDPDAAGLVVCMDCDHADEVASLLKAITGTRPAVACSRLNDPDDPAPRPVIDAFQRGTAPWIVCVKMISEGVDIRRLRVLVYATNVATELAFRQITGRVVRTDPKNGDSDWGIVYLPAEPILMGMAERLLEEVPSQLRRPLVVRDPSEPSGSIRGSTERGEFVPLHSTGNLQMIRDTTGRSAPAELVAAAERYVATTRSNIPPFELALAAANDPELRARLLAY